ncbi:MAG: hypothetical protein OS112_03235 [Methanoregula sp.]|nr:MAG: hypothetical protein OS112_03235 [Methanoregula sp.]
MTSKGYRFTNRRVRDELSRILKRVAPGDVVTTERLCEIVNIKNRNRDFSRRRIGSLLREREDLHRVGDGIWQVVR